MPYEKEGVGNNCPKDVLITSQGTCEHALRSLGLNRTNLLVNGNNRPAGCYWKPGGKGFFNHNVNPTLTDPKLFHTRGGVCLKWGKINLLGALQQQ